MSDPPANAFRLAFWPLPFVLVALVCVASGWPGTKSAFWLIGALNFGIVYALLLLAVAAIRRRISRRTVLVTTAFCIIYHIIAAILPRPESGWVRIGFGDVMVVGGALVYGLIDDLADRNQQDALRDPDRLAAALTTDNTDEFRVIGSHRDGDGWLVYGQLRDKKGIAMSHITRLREPFALETTSLERINFGDDWTIADGALRALTTTEILTVVPPRDPDLVAIPTATRRWLVSGTFRETTYDHGEWLVLKAGLDSGAVGRIDATGHLVQSVELAVTNANASSIVRVGDTIYAMTQHFDQVPEQQVHVVRDGQRHSAESDRLTAIVAEHALGTPVRLVKSKTKLWVTGYQDEWKSEVAVTLPDGEPIALQPGSVTGVSYDGDELIVATYRAMLRVGRDQTVEIATGWIPRRTLSIHEGSPSAAVKRRSDHTLQLVTLVHGAPRAFLPEIRLRAF